MSKLSLWNSSQCEVDSALIPGVHVRTTNNESSSSLLELFCSTSCWKAKQKKRGHSFSDFAPGDFIIVNLNHRWRLYLALRSWIRFHGSLIWQSGLGVLSYIKTRQDIILSITRLTASFILTLKTNTFLRGTKVCFELEHRRYNEVCKHFHRRGSLYQAAKVNFGSNVVQFSFHKTSRSEFGRERTCKSSSKRGKFPNLQKLCLDEILISWHVILINPCCRLFIDFASSKTHNVATTRIESSSLD